MNELNTDIYENIIVGNFLFGLGAAMQLQHRDRAMPLASINLLQQTPLDESFADVLIRTPGAIRLLEFKRKANTSIKERSKLWMLKKGLRSQAYPPERMARLRVISREMHWYIESANQMDRSAKASRGPYHDAEVLKGSNFRVRIVPYLDFMGPGGYEDLATFVQDMAKQASSEPTGLMSEYVDYLQLLARSRGSALSGALLVSISQFGELRYVAVDDLREVFFAREAVLERMLEKQYLLKEQHLLEKQFLAEQGYSANQNEIER